MKHLLSAIAICLLFSFKAYSFTQIVTVQNHVFTPASFTINLGDTIKWTWINGSHTTTSLTIPAGAAAWDHPIKSSNKSFTYVPAVAGLYNYKCTPHQAMGMVGNFTVASACPPASAQISAASATTFCKGGSVLLNSSVSANITAYQWEKNGANISKATSSTYTASVTGSYTLMVTNNCGNKATSNAIKVTVNPVPVATITPADSVLICKGDSVTLVATSGASLAYQWQRNTVNIAGATSKTYTANTGGNYKVMVTKTTTGCSKLSAPTKVIIQCPDFATAKSNDDAIRVFPNPSSSSFHILIPSFNNAQYFITIYDVNGKITASNKISSGDFTFGNELKPGIYLVQIKNGSAIIFQDKIIKQ